MSIKSIPLLIERLALPDALRKHLRELPDDQDSNKHEKNCGTNTNTNACKKSDQIRKKKGRGRVEMVTKGCKKTEAYQS